MIDNFIEEQWREFYSPYTFGELHSPTHSSVEETKSEDNSLPKPIGIETSGLDNPLEEELYIQQHKYTTEEI